MIEDKHQYNNEPLPPKHKIPLRKLCPNTLRYITFLAKIKQHHNLIRTIIQVPGEANIHYALLMHYYKVSMGYSLKNPKYKFLTDDEKSEIIRLRIAGYSLKYIAEKLNRNVSTIYYFCKRKNIL